MKTAYGDALDRAVLAAAMMRAAGVEARPVFRSAELGKVDAGAAGFSRFGEVFVCVTGEQVQRRLRSARKLSYDEARHELGPDGMEAGDWEGAGASPRSGNGGRGEQPRFR